MARKLSRRTLAQYAARELAEGTATKVVARRLVAYLMENHRLSELTILIRDITAQLADLGHVTGTLTTAHELTDATVKEITEFTKSRTGAQKVTLDTEVDQSVIGGIKLELPGRELDTTIARKLTVLKTRYKKA